MVFSNHTFYPISNLSSTVPILTVGGIAKQFVVPGWRVGWIIIHDRMNQFIHLREAMNTLTQVLLGCNTLIQAAIPELLHHTEMNYYQQLMKTLETQAMYLYEKIDLIDGLKAIEPQGAMYLMVTNIT
jgi:tyrosine aminotransferase